MDHANQEMAGEGGHQDQPRVEVEDRADHRVHFPHLGVEGEAEVLLDPVAGVEGEVLHCLHQEEAVVAVVGLDLQLQEERLPALSFALFSQFLTQSLHLVSLKFFS